MAKTNADATRLPSVVCMFFDVMRSTQTRVEINASSFRIGRPPCEIQCVSPFVPEVVASVRRDGDDWFLLCYASKMLQLDGVDVAKDDRIKLKKTASLTIGPPNVGTLFTILVNFPKSRSETTEERVQRLDDAITIFADKTHSTLLERMRDDLENDAWKRKNDVKGSNSSVGSVKRASNDDDKTNVESELVAAVEGNIEAIARELGFFEEESRETTMFMAGVSIRDQVVKRLLEGDEASVDVGLPDIFDEEDRHYGRLLSASPEHEKKMEEASDYIIGVGLKIPKPPREYDVNGNKRPKYDDEYDEYLKNALDVVEKSYWEYWFTVNGKISNDFAYYLALRYLKKTIKDLVFGYGPLEDLLRTPAIAEIMVVNYKTIYIERKGRLENSGRRFFSEKISEKIINDIVKRVNREVNASTPLVDARLSDGSRVNAVIAPLAVGGSCLTIRRFPTKRLTIDELVEKKNSMSQAAADFLRASILARKNILVSGGTGTGKTTLLNCLCDYVPDNERIVTVEDTVELRIAKRHVVRLEAKAANAEGKGAYTIRDLVKNALRMRPDRVIVGECRGGEALDMLQAMNTGHDGSLTTIHANSARDAILRLETLVLQSDAKLPIESIDRQIASAIDLIVQLKRMRGGRRCVSQIVEVTDIDPENGEIRTREIYALDSDAKEDAQLRPTGSLPSYMHTLVAKKWLDLEKFYFN